MRAIVTGSRGTVGTALVAALERAGHVPVRWDRSRVPIDNYHAMLRHVESSRAEAIFHLAMASNPTGRENEGWLVNWQWPSELAWIARTVGIPFVYTSTVLVWTNDTPGPLRPETPTDATDDYGGGKRSTEERVWYQNPGARVARLGWQIGSAPGSNNMIDFFHRRMAGDGVVRASRRWMPACALVEDTAEALIRLVDMSPGLYLLNSNQDMNFFEIASALAARHGGAWRVEPTQDFVCDQRMLDDRPGLPDLRTRLAPVA